MLVGELAPNPYSFHEENNDISLDTPLDLSISVVCFSQSKSSTGNLAKELLSKFYISKLKKRSAMLHQKIFDLENRDQ